MARKTKRFTSGGSTYEIFQLGGMTATEYSVTVLNLALGVLPLLLSAGSIAKIDVSQVSLDWAKLEPLVRVFSEHGYLIGSKGKVQLSEVFDEQFAGDLDGVTELVLQSIELNYASFLERRLGQRIDVSGLRLRPMDSSESESQTDSTGTPGES